MKIFKSHVQVRWSDLDPNMHLANQAYMSFTSFARMKALNELGFDTKHMHIWKRGPVIFEEKFNFFREILPDTTIYIHTKISGVSEDFVLFEFEHDLYDEQGQHKAKSKIFGCWLDFTTRKMATELPQEMLKIMEALDTEGAKKLSKMDIKNLGVAPQNINPEDLK